MTTQEERQWELMRKALLAEAQGKEVQPVASRRTLFGIPSTVDRVIAKVAAEEDARCQRIIDQKACASRKDRQPEG
jgi:hypothetical protein